MKHPLDIKPKKVKRPWGFFTQFLTNAPSTVKIITVLPDQSLSLQYHAHRQEFWHVISGSGTVTIGTRKRAATAGTEFTVAPKQPHRITAGENGLVVLEIATGDFDENDIVRLEDKYGRVIKK